MTLLGAESRPPEVSPGLETEILPGGGGVEGPVGPPVGGDHPALLLVPVGVPAGHTVRTAPVT